MELDERLARIEANLEALREVVSARLDYQLKRIELLEVRMQDSDTRWKELMEKWDKRIWAIFASILVELVLLMLHGGVKP